MDIEKSLSNLEKQIDVFRITGDGVAGSFKTGFTIGGTSGGGTGPTKIDEPQPEDHEGRIKALEKQFNNFTISGGPDVTVEGSMEHGFAINARAIQEAAITADVGGGDQCGTPITWTLHVVISGGGFSADVTATVPLTWVEPDTEAVCQAIDGNVSTLDLILSGCGGVDSGSTAADVFGGGIQFIGGIWQARLNAANLGIEFCSTAYFPSQAFDTDWTVDIGPNLFTSFTATQTVVEPTVGDVIATWNGVVFHT